jgi:hypothetical protein
VIDPWRCQTCGARRRTPEEAAVPDQPDQRRDAAIEAVLDVLGGPIISEIMCKPGNTLGSLAAALVDAVHAAGRDDRGDGAGVGERSGEGGTGGSGSHGERRCPRCGEPTTGTRSQPAMEDYSRGYVETVAVAITYQPCGCTYTKDVRKRTDGGEHG